VYRFLLIRKRAKTITLELIDITEVASTLTGVAIVHETHCGKWSFAMHITRHYLQTFQQIRLVFNVFHWCNLAQTPLLDQREAVQLTIELTWRIHAWVGHAGGLQVPDPCLPKWKEALHVDLKRCDVIIDKRKQEGVEYFTNTPEFGALPYITEMPLLATHILSQWDINAFMMQLLSRCYLIAMVAKSPKIDFQQVAFL